MWLLALFIYSFDGVAIVPTIRVQEEDLLHSLSKLYLDVKAKKMTIAQEKIVIPLKRRSFEPLNANSLSKSKK